MSTNKRPWRVLLAAAALTLAWSAAAPAAGISGSDQAPLPPTRIETAKAPRAAVHPQVKRAKRASTMTRTRRTPVRVASQSNVSWLCREFHFCGYLPLFLGVAY